MTTHGDEGRIVRYSEFLAYGIIPMKMALDFTEFDVILKSN